MLMDIREWAKGWLAWVLIGLLVVIFGLWGIADYVGGNTESRPVAKVNGEDIDLQTAQRVYEAVLAQQQAVFAANNVNVPLNEQVLKQQVLDQLVIQEVVRQAAVKAGFSISDQNFYQELATIPEFQQEGVYSPQLFAQAAVSLGMTPQALQQEVIEQLLVEQPRIGMQASAFVLPSEVEQSLALYGESRQINYLSLNLDRYRDDIEISDDAINDYYEQHQDDFQTPEQVSVNYVRLRLDDLKNNVQLSEQDIQNYYQQNISNYTQPEERRVSQILVSLPADASPDQVAQAQAKIDDIQQRLDQGEDFSTLASEFSDDFVSRRQGGDIGWLTQDSNLDPAFVDGAFSVAQVGDVSSPIRSAFGFHLIELNDIHPEERRPFAEVSDAIAEQLRNEHANSEFARESQELSLLAFEQSDSLEGISDELGLPIQETALFDQSGGEEDSITSEPRVIQAAFSDDVLLDGYNSDLIQINPDDVVVIRVNQHESASTRPLDEVYDNIKTRLVNREAGERAQADGQAIVNLLQNEAASSATVAEQYNIDWMNDITLMRDPSSNQDISPEMVSAVFNMVKPIDEQHPTTLGITLNDGSYAVVRLSTVTPGSVDDENVLELFAQQLEQAQANEDYQLYIDNLYQHARIQTYPDRF